MSNGSKITVLLVDDEDFWSRAELLEHYGLEVLSCHRLSDALDALKWKKIDVVVSDIRFPKISSEEVGNFLRRCSEIGLGIIVLTGARWDSPPKEYSGMMVLEKPMRASELRAAISECYEASQAKIGAGKIRVLVVDDNERAADSFPEALNYSGWCVAKGCTSIAQARELMSKERFDVVVSDILIPDSTREEVEQFLRETVSAGMGLMIYSGGVWDETPKIDGAVILKRSGSFEEYLDSVRKAARQRGRAKAGGTDFHKIANPDRHIESPMLKWERSILEPSSGIPPDALYLEYLRREMREASGRGYSKRELNDLMDKYVRHEARVRKLSGK